MAEPEPKPASGSESPARWLIGAGLLVAAVYALTGPGRIDIVDGQHRFEVAKNLLAGKGPVLLDPALIRAAALQPSTAGPVYSSYAPGGALLGVPLLALGKLLGGSERTLLFCFSLSSALYAGLAAAAHGAILHLHGFGRRSVLAALGLLALASPMWWMGTTVFHQLQFTAFLVAGLWCSCVAARCDQAAWAFAAGLVGGFATFAQESAILLVPWLAVPLLFAPARATRRLALATLCGAGALLWVGGLLLANRLRFGSALFLSKLENPTHPPLWGSFRLGFEILTFSVGNSWVLYAPSFVLALIGAVFAWRTARALVLAVLGMWITQYLFRCCLSFSAGDWAWGPRYLLGMAPLVTLPLPWLFQRRRWRPLLATVCALSFAIQLLSVTVDHLRFFVDQRYTRFLGYETPGVYFERSQLWARLAELRALRLGPVADFVPAFRPGPYPELSGYAPLGLSALHRDEYPLFLLPRPWPLWSAYVPERMRPTEPLVALPLLFGIALAGGLLLRSRAALLPRSPVQRRLLRFATTGGICFSINLAVLYAGTELLRLHYALSLLLSLLVVNLVGLLINRRWTFESTRNPFWAEALRYWSANALSALAVLASTALLVEVLHVHYLLANVLIAVLFLLGNFVLHQSWTFRARVPPSIAQGRRHQ